MSDSPYGSGATLYVDGVRVWHNPKGIGHAFVGYRKDQAELNLIERLIARESWNRIRRLGDTPCQPYEGTDAETPEEIGRSYRRREAT